ncbi:cation:proton antiporter [Corynebacterium breve]|uniref:Cation:proton antiporter n=1 Tax=Corynebacterium breve TaxID=3049799 RepID=A0ABY8VFN2_9CORY|nr:cation:proton antiporter [Corynebacterium breve]WIM67922.1 cation:proton antiporter [Corynebacterium breve]
MFQTIIIVCIAIMAVSMLAGLIKIVATGDNFTRAVLSDLIFYSMIVIFLAWTLINDSLIAYEVAILAALVAGVLPTLSMARIISKGRR